MSEDLLVSLKSRGEILAALLAHPDIQYKGVLIALEAPAFTEFMKLAGRRISVHEVIPKIIAATGALFTYTSRRDGSRPVDFGGKMLHIFLASAEDVPVVGREIEKILPHMDKYR